MGGQCSALSARLRNDGGSPPDDYLSKGAGGKIASGTSWRRGTYVEGIRIYPALGSVCFVKPLLGFLGGDGA
jgi:hypothetical protein